MSEVKRYLHGSETGTPGTFRMLERPYGDYVKFSDYDTLRAELEETKAGHQRVMDALKDSHTVHVNILRGEIVLTDAALLHIAKTRGIDGETLRRERDEAVKALEGALSAHKHDYDMMNPPEPEMPLCLCSFCNNYREWTEALNNIKGSTT